MKKIVYLFCVLIFGSCENENANKCFQKAGDIVQIEVEVPEFEKIVVHEFIELIITQGDEQKVVVESGENLLSEISVEVIDNELVLYNYNDCNFVRPYDLTKVYVTSPSIKAIRNASEQAVSSVGVLTYPSLYLESAGNKKEFLSIGDWHLTIENESVSVFGNGLAVFYLKGKTNNLNITFSDGDTRFEGENFMANHITVYQVSSNDMLVYPLESIKGTIHSTGNVISYNKPPIVAVDVLNTYGTLIFK
jgi:hypothetical protein